MGMQSASVQQSPNQGGGKGFAQPTGLRPQGDYGDPTFDKPQPMPAQLNQLMGGQYNPNPYQNGQFNSDEQFGSGIPNTQMYAQPAGGPPMNQQPMGGQNGQPDASMMAPAVMPHRQNQAMGKGGSNVTMPGQGRQPRMGQPNAYSNTIQPWDNASIQPQKQSGKGKGY
jgi:hypothetical protein